MLELKPVVVSTSLPKNFPHTSKREDILVRMDCSYIAVPLDVFVKIVPVAHRLDYDWHGGTKCWRFNTTQEIPYELITTDHITAMKVAELLK